jgi:hypothetical protein
MSAYPRLNRAALRAAVRELTAIHSTDIVSDARVNDLLNARLYEINAIADTIPSLWPSVLSPITPITVVESGVTYRYPGWRWDNTTQFPTDVQTDLYMESDGDTPPWLNGSHDMALVYGAAADVLKYVNDDSARVAEFTTKFNNLRDTIFRDEFINHNSRLVTFEFDPTDANGNALQQISLAIYALNLIGQTVAVDAFYEISVPLAREVLNQLDEMWSAFRWPSPMTKAFNSFAPYVEVFAYGAAARHASFMGADEAKVQALLAGFNSRKDALLREKLYSVSGILNSSTIGNATSQVRALLQDFSNDLPENLIYSWLNIAFQTLAQERAWPWLEFTANLSFAAGANNVDLTSLGMSNRVLNVYEVRYNGAGDVIDSEIVYPVPHTLDGKVGDAKYTYDVVEGFFIVSPTPTETTYFRVRFIVNTPSITGPSSLIYFDPRFSDILAYRAAVIGSAWSDYGKKMREVFQDTADKLFEGIVSFYMLDHSTEPMQLGGSALETKKYLPWFRTA